MDIYDDSGFKKIKKVLDKVSPCFCPSKWNRTTIHFHLAQTHSCHHPELHSLEVENIKNDPFALYNTEHIVQQRRNMLFGVRPTECDYCWRVEDIGTNSFSDRVSKNRIEELTGELNDILKDPLSNKRIPSKLEISFNNNCQMKCSYCSARFSTSWNEEIKKFGIYDVKPDQVQNINDENMKIIKNAFWSTLPQVKEKLKVLRITGGEPLLSNETYQLLESFLDQPAPQLELSINSNLSISEEILVKYIKILKEIKDRNLVADITIHTSLDAWAEKAEYIRYGLNHERFWNNIKTIFSASPDLNVRIMSTYNVLSTTSFLDLLKKVREFNKTDQFASKRKDPLYVDIHHLRNPEFLSVVIGKNYFIEPVEKLLADLIKWKADAIQFPPGKTQINSVIRILEMMKAPLSVESENKLKSDFYRFFSEHDKRRNTNFLNAFPEMSDFWNDCHSAHLRSLK